MYRGVYKFFVFLELIIALYLGYLIYKEIKINKPLKDEYKIYKSYLERRLKENKELKERLNYLSDPENFKKELKDKFNLVERGEKVIILPENFIKK